VEKKRQGEFIIDKGHELEEACKKAGFNTARSGER
jgi:hypothetical protein